MRLQFILSETLSGLRRNLSMVISVVLVALATVTLVGLSWLAQRQVDASKDYWYDKVEVSVFLCGDVSNAPSCAGGAITQTQRDQIRSDLEKMPQVQKIYYESKQEAYKRFKQQFKSSAIVDNVTAEQMPESFRVKLTNPEQYPIIASAFIGRNGIEQVQDQKALLAKFFKMLKWMQ